MYRAGWNAAQRDVTIKTNLRDIEHVLWAFRVNGENPGYVAYGYEAVGMAQTALMRGDLRNVGQCFSLARRFMRALLRREPVRGVRVYPHGR